MIVLRAPLSTQIHFISPQKAKTDFDLKMDIEYCSDGSSSGEYTSGSADEYEDQAAEDLAEGKVSVKNKNGNLWCPYCAGKKKIDYKYSELLQHALGVSKGKRGVEAAGNHRALAKYLKEKLSHLAEPPKERVIHLEQETPEQIDLSQEKLVWPWMGVIVNIDNRKIENGKRVGPGNSEIKSRFASFHPVCVHTLWNYRGHQGMAVVQFEKDMIGYGHAQDFERSFLKSGRGRTEWQNKLESSEGPGKDLYGWVANEHDYNSRDAIGKHLREKGNLRTVAEVSETCKRQQDQLVQNMDATIQDQNQKLRDSTRELFGLKELVILIEEARLEAENQKTQMEEQHRREKAAIELEAKEAIKMCEEQTRREWLAFHEKYEELKLRCNELEKLEVHNDQERENKESEMNKNEKKIQLYQQIQDLHKEHQAKKMMLIKKQQEESKILRSDQHQRELTLMNQHKLEQEIQALEAMIESKKLEAAEIPEDNSSIRVLEERLNELKEEKDHLEETNQSLTYKERELNTELTDGRQAALEALLLKGDPECIGIKRMGELDEGPWTPACREKFKDSPDGWEIAKVTEFSKWEENIRDSQWHPFKVVEVKEGKHEELIDEADEKLSELRGKLGEEVYRTVVVALQELQEYNASGRYPIPVPWNFQTNRRATIAEIITFLAKEKPAKRRKRRNAL